VTILKQQKTHAMQQDPVKLLHIRRSQLIASLDASHPTMEATETPSLITRFALILNHTGSPSPLLDRIQSVLREEFSPKLVDSYMVLSDARSYHMVVYPDLILARSDCHRLTQYVQLRMLVEDSSQPWLDIISSTLYTESTNVPLYLSMHKGSRLTYSADSPVPQIDDHYLIFARTTLAFLDPDIEILRKEMRVQALPGQLDSKAVQLWNRAETIPKESLSTLSINRPMSEERPFDLVVYSDSGALQDLVVQLQASRLPIVQSHLGSDFVVVRDVSGAIYSIGNATSGRLGRPQSSKAVSMGHGHGMLSSSASATNLTNSPSSSSFSPVASPLHATASLPVMSPSSTSNLGSPTSPASNSSSMSSMSSSSSSSSMSSSHGLLGRVDMKDPVLSIAGGASHTLLLTDRGTVYGFGANYHSQLAHAVVVEHQTSSARIMLPSVPFAPAPLAVPIPFAHAIASGDHHCAAICDTKRIPYIWGAVYGPVPRNVPKIDRVKLLACGGPLDAPFVIAVRDAYPQGDTLYMIDANVQVSTVSQGTVWSSIAASSSKSYYALSIEGLLFRGEGKELTAIEFFSAETRLSGIACCASHAVGITDYGDVYTWNSDMVISRLAVFDQLAVHAVSLSFAYNRLNVLAMTDREVRLSARGRLARKFIHEERMYHTTLRALAEATWVAKGLYMGNIVPVHALLLAGLTDWAREAYSHPRFSAVFNRYSRKLAVAHRDFIVNQNAIRELRGAKVALNRMAFYESYFNTLLQVTDPTHEDYPVIRDLQAFLTSYARFLYLKTEKFDGKVNDRDEYEGYGCLVKEGETCEGYWEAGKLSRYGISITRNSSYMGAFKEGKRCGWGIHVQHFPPQKFGNTIGSVAIEKNGDMIVQSICDHHHHAHHHSSGGAGNSGGFDDCGNDCGNDDSSRGDASREGIFVFGNSDYCLSGTLALPDMQVSNGQIRRVDESILKTVVGSLCTPLHELSDRISLIASCFHDRYAPSSVNSDPEVDNCCGDPNHYLTCNTPVSCVLCGRSITTEDAKGDDNQYTQFWHRSLAVHITCLFKRVSESGPFIPSVLFPEKSTPKLDGASWLTRFLSLSHREFGLKLKMASPTGVFLRWSIYDPVQLEGSLEQAAGLGLDRLQLSQFVSRKLCTSDLYQLWHRRYAEYDVRCNESIRRYASATPADFGVRREFAIVSYTTAIQYLHQMDSMSQNPYDICDALLMTKYLINWCWVHHFESSNEAVKSAGGDETRPLFWYCVVKAQWKDLFSRMSLVTQWIEARKWPSILSAERMGQVESVLADLEGCCQFLLQQD
jgi:hypothetical protein